MDREVGQDKGKKKKKNNEELGRGRSVGRGLDRCCRYARQPP